jgi:hypothetical protein
VKSLKDVHRIREDQKIAFEVQKRLQRINEPYVVTFEANADAKLADVPAAVKDLRRAIRLLNETIASFPWFNLHGLRFEMVAPAKRKRGYLGIVTSEFRFTDEHCRVIRSRIADVGSITRIGKELTADPTDTNEDHTAEMLSAADVLKYIDPRDRFEPLRAAIRKPRIRVVARLSGVSGLQLQAIVNQEAVPNASTINRVESALRALTECR